MHPVRWLNHEVFVQSNVSGHARFGRVMNLKTVAIVASGLISGGVLATGSYWYASPYLAVNSIREAIQQKDGSRFNQYVDYPQLREDLKAYVVTSLTQAATEESLDDAEEGLAALGTALVIPIANTLIDSYLTSEVVKGLIEASEGDLPRAQKTSANPFSVPDLQAEIAKGKQQFEKQIDQMANVEMAYVGMNQFLVSGRLEPGVKIGFEMARQGLGDWKIAGLILPDYQQLQALALEDESVASDDLAVRPRPEGQDEFEDPSFETPETAEIETAEIETDDIALANAADQREPGPSLGVNAMPPDLSTCWFQMRRSGEEFTGFQCTVVSRVNANGNTVYDVIEPNGVKRAIVLWDDSSAEVFLRGQRYEGFWEVDAERDVRIQLPQGAMAFRRPR
ncbi:MAG: DUF2939 domain-containing protein [Synechococcus sp. TMED20]|nr:MAG: DUF2939 domain-containing protein [Synechococcus sp. TMED20]